MARSTLAVTVADKKRLSPNMIRLMLQGDSLKDFPTGYEGGYIKLVFPRGLERPVVRSYTVREFSACLLYTSPSPRDQRGSRMPSSA